MSNSHPGRSPGASSNHQSVLIHCSHADHILVDKSMATTFDLTAAVKTVDYLLYKTLSLSELVLFLCWFSFYL